MAAKPGSERRPRRSELPAPKAASRAGQSAGGQPPTRAPAPAPATPPAAAPPSRRSCGPRAAGHRSADDRAPRHRAGRCRRCSLPPAKPAGNAVGPLPAATGGNHRAGHDHRRPDHRERHGRFVRAAASQFDPKVVKLNDAGRGDFFSSDGQIPLFTKNIQNDAGAAAMNLNRLPNSPGVSGSGVLTTLIFQACRQRLHHGDGSQSHGAQRAGPGVFSGSPPDDDQREVICAVRTRIKADLPWWS